MKRTEQALLIVSFLTFCWLTMQAVHELGHVLAAHATGAEIIKVYLYPTLISSTEVGDNPHPLVEVWAGPILGSMLPLLVFFVAKGCRISGLYLFRFFAGFCLIANGVYLAFGPSEGGADTAILLQHGASRWGMILFGLLTAPLGLFLWHGQGAHFGLGDAGGKVDRAATVVSVLLCIMLIGVELVANRR